MGWPNGFLFKYRLTPQTTTGHTPAEILMGRRPKSRLDPLRPDMKAKVEGKQEKQKDRHDQHARERQLKLDDCFYVRNFSSNNDQQWLPGVVLKRSGPVSYVVKLTDRRIFRRHVCLRHHTGESQCCRVSNGETDSCGGQSTRKRDRGFQVIQRGGTHMKGLSPYLGQSKLGVSLNGGALSLL